MAKTNFNIYLKDNGNSGYLNLFSAQSCKNSRSIVRVKNPLKIGTIDKYFKSEEDLETIKESLLDTPIIYTFDQVYAEDRFDSAEDLIQDLNKKIRSNFSDEEDGMFFLFTTFDWKSLIFKQNKLRRSLLKTLVDLNHGTVEIKASLMLEDLTTDLLISDIFETLAGTDKFKEVTGLEELRNQIKTIERNLSEIKDKFKIQHVERIAHVLLSIKIQNTVQDLLIFPMFDSQFSKSKDKVTEWNQLVSVLKGEWRQKAEQNNSSQMPCYLKFIQSKLSTRQVEIYTLLSSSKENVKDNIPFLEGLTNFRNSTKKSPSEKVNNMKKYPSPPLNQNIPSSGYKSPLLSAKSQIVTFAEQLIEEIDVFCKNTQYVVNTQLDRASFELGQQQLGDLKRKLIEFQLNGNLSKAEIRSLMSAAQKKLLEIRIQVENAYHSVDLSLSRSAFKDSQSLFHPQAQQYNSHGKFMSYTDQKAPQRHSTYQTLHPKSLFNQHNPLDRINITPNHHQNSQQPQEYEVKTLYIPKEEASNFQAKSNSRSRKSKSRSRSPKWKRRGSPSQKLAFSPKSVLKSMKSGGSSKYKSLKKEFKEFRNAVLSQFKKLNTENKGNTGYQLGSRTSRARTNKHKTSNSPGLGSVGSKKLKKFNTLDGRQFKKFQNQQRSIKNIKIMNTGIQPRKEYYHPQNKQHTSRLDHIVNRLQKEKLDEFSSYLNDSTEYSSSTDSLQSQLGSRYRQLLIKKVTKQIRSQNKAANQVLTTLPDNQAILLKYKKLRKDNKRMKSSIKELKLLLKNKETLLNDKKKDIIKMELNKDKLTDEIDQLKIEKDQVLLQLKNMESNADELNDLVEIQQIKKQEKKQKWSIARQNMELEMDNLREELDCQMTEKQLLQARILELEKDKEISLQKNGIMVAELDSLKQQINSFQHQAEDLDSRANSNENKNIELGLRLDVANTKNEDLIQQNLKLKEKNARLNQQNLELQSGNLEAQNILLEQKDEIIAGLEQQLSKIKSMLENENRTNQDLEEMVELLRVKLDEQADELTESTNYKVQITEFMKKLDDCQLEVDQLAELNRLQAEKIEALENEKEQLTSSNYQLEVNMDAWKNGKNESNQYIAELEEENKLLNIEKEDLAQKNEDLISKVSKLETLQNEEWDRLERKVQDTLDNLKEARDQNLMLEAQLQEYSNLETGFGEATQELKQKYKSKKEENRMLQGQILKLNSDLGEVESKFEQCLSLINEKELQ